MEVIICEINLDCHHRKRKQQNRIVLSSYLLAANDLSHQIITRKRDYYKSLMIRLNVRFNVLRSVKNSAVIKF